MDELIFNFGSLIYPKEMLKLLQFQTDAKMKVINIYNYLYKFSLERLQHLLNNESLMLFLLVYLEINKYSRIHQSPNMHRYKEAYYEACEIMIKHSIHKDRFAKIFDLP